ncbi:MAG: sugar transferase [Gammaproteobacteria bacterium]
MHPKSDRLLGFNNQLIEVLKFPTRHVAFQDEHAERHSSRGDPRVTRVRAFLRRTSLDESKRKRRRCRSSVRSSTHLATKPGET